MQSATTAPRNPSLDGIRGIAIAMVLVHHAFQMTTASGPLGTLLIYLADSAWVGVDLFFVLSGYLITGILLDSRDGEGYFSTFYMRRFFRIFPLYYAYLGGLFLVSLLWPGWPQDFASFRIDQLWNFSYLSNVRMALHHWVWRPVDHLWSLAVEEQFYLLWPALVFVMPRRRTSTTILLLLGLFIIIRQVAFVPGQEYAVYGLVHLDGLLAGSALAAIRRNPWTAPYVKRVAGPVLLTGCVILTIQLFLYQGLHWGDWNGLGYLNYSLVALTGAALVAVSIYSDAHTAVNRLLTTRPLLKLGKYSYAIYLLHFPLDWALRKCRLHPDGTIASIPYTILLGIAAYLCARVTWSLIEMPSMRLRDRWFAREVAGSWQGQHVEARTP